MKIAPQTKENFLAACLSQSAVARSLGVSTATVNQVVNGTYPSLNGKDAQKVVKFLQARNLLVLEAEPEPEEGGTVTDSDQVATTTH